MRILTTIACLCFLASSALAQRHPVHSSVESYVCGAYHVYVGAVTNVGPTEPTRPDGVIPFEMEVTVDEVLKGAKRKSFKVLQYTWMSGTVREEWLGLQGKQMLWFVGNDMDRDRHTSARTMAVEPYPGDIYSKGWGNFTMDFQVLRSGKETLDYVRAFCREFKERTEKGLGLRLLPRLVCVRFPGHRTGGELIVPICPRLQSVALRMIRSPEKVLPTRKEMSHVSDEDYEAMFKEDTGTLRRMGVECLATFKSRNNIALLKGFLNDPFIEMDPQRDWRVKVYSVRRAAYEVLTKWGVQVDKPTWDVGSP